MIEAIGLRRFQGPIVRETTEDLPYGGFNFFLELFNLLTIHRAALYFRTISGNMIATENFPMHSRVIILATCLASLLATQAALQGQEIKVPAFTAYVDPNNGAAQVGPEGIVGWGSKDTVIWGGRLSEGELKVSIQMNLPAGATSRLKLTIAGQTKEAAITGAADPVIADFGSFKIASGGYQKIELAGISKTGKTFGDIRELILSGSAAKDAFFNLKPRRNAASVHLHYPMPKGVEAAWFYNELTPRTDPVATYYEACGFSRGYFGMQVNSPTERRVIFSIWDAGYESIDRKKVKDENRVTLLAKGDGVYAGDFGNEGTGGHSHLIYNWKTGQTQRFLVTAKVDGDATIYSGYFYFTEKGKWGLIASFRAPHDGKLLRDLYSFNENFGGGNGYLQRLCEFGNQWIKTPQDKWIELTTAHFTHDATGGKDRLDFGAGVTKDGRFYLSNGGFHAEPVKSGDAFTRPVTGKPPTDITLP
jgi:hypothetical protein